MNHKIKNWIYTAIGIFIILSPFLGFPKTIKDTLYILAGLVIVWLTFSNGSKTEDMSEEDLSESKKIRV